jgi:hypothetical protein
MTYKNIVCSEHLLSGSIFMIFAFFTMKTLEKCSRLRYHSIKTAGLPAAIAQTACPGKQKFTRTKTYIFIYHIKCPSLAQTYLRKLSNKFI